MAAQQGDAEELGNGERARVHELLKVFKVLGQLTHASELGELGEAQQPQHAVDATDGRVDGLGLRG